MDEIGESLSGCISTPAASLGRRTLGQTLKAVLLTLKYYFDYDKQYWLPADFGKSQK